MDKPPFYTDFVLPTEKDILCKVCAHKVKSLEAFDGHCTLQGRQNIDCLDIYIYPLKEICNGFALDSSPFLSTNREGVICPLP